MSTIEDLQKEVSWLKYELSLVPSSRRRMMQRTIATAFQRDAALTLLKDNNIEPPFEISSNFNDAQINAMCNLLQQYNFDLKEKVLK
jgi:hypothetical protein